MPPSLPQHCLVEVGVGSILAEVATAGQVVLTPISCELGVWPVSQNAVSHRVCPAAGFETCTFKVRTHAHVGVGEEPLVFVSRAMTMLQVMCTMRELGVAGLLDGVDRIFMCVVFDRLPSFPDKPCNLLHACNGMHVGLVFNSVQILPIYRVVY